MGGRGREHNARDAGGGAAGAGRRPASGGGHWVSVAPERIETWVAGFADRHGGHLVSVTGDERGVVLRGADGGRAEFLVPFPPMPPAAPDGLIAALAVHARAERCVGVVLVRRGGYATGVFHGTDLLASKVGSRLVQGRSAAGGWSQQRFARRREQQAGQAREAAAEVAARVLAPYLDRLEAVVFGGDRRAVDALRADRRLAPAFAIETGPFLAVPDPRLAVLRDTPRSFRAVRVRVVEAGEAAGDADAAHQV
ncbi:acVLRF1 family peptidyl-tRNA hydrolase [Spongiactinospora rosea]|uniref:acVLRF1 family peptidyl-tRNA hydrolase n=1 Tax=Spongiactinospora rosea TaxID=2248750 RepID=UPI001CECEA29|nr:acVLRF1 family peptidyl-tRNA hydrolase [Spongiactinospora rosea]